MSLLLRGDDACNLRLVMFSPYSTTVTSPHRAFGVQCNVQMSKTNPGDRVDLRAMVSHRYVNQDSLVHLGLHFWAKLCGSHGRPFQWTSIISGEWCVFVSGPPAFLFPRTHAVSCRMHAAVNNMHESLLHVVPHMQAYLSSS